MRFRPQSVDVEGEATGWSNLIRRVVPPRGAYQLQPWAPAVENVYDFGVSLSSCSADTVLQEAGAGAKFRK